MWSLHRFTPVGFVWDDGSLLLIHNVVTNPVHPILMEKWRQKKMIQTIQAWKTTQNHQINHRLHWKKQGLCFNWLWTQWIKEGHAKHFLPIRFHLREKSINQSQVWPELPRQKQQSRPESATRGPGTCAGWAPRRSRWPVMLWPDPAYWQRWAAERLSNSPRQSARTAPAHTHIGATFDSILCTIWYLLALILLVIRLLVKGFTHSPAPSLQNASCPHCQ